MGKLNPPSQLDLVAAASAERRGVPFANAVQCENRRFVVRTREKRAGRVTFMVIDEQNRSVVGIAEFGANDVAEPGLFTQPNGNRHRETAKALWRVRKIGFEKALELPQRFFVKNGVIEVSAIYASLPQTIVDGV